MKRKAAVSLHLFERLGAEALSRRFDQLSFAVLSIGYLTLNLALPLAVSGGELFKHLAIAALSIDWQTVTCEAWCIDK